MGHRKLRIVFFGTPEFAAYSLEAMVKEGFDIAAVVTAPDKPAGRGQKPKSSAVKQTAEQLKLPVLQPPNLKAPEFIEQLQSLRANLGVVIAFRMMPESVWSAPELGTLNLHASLLPDYRGAAPINHAIINGETMTGVTTFFLKHEIDTGDIIFSEPVKIEPEETAGELHDKLMVKGSELVIKTLHAVESGNWPVEPQSPNSSLHNAPKISKEFCELDLTQSAQNVFNKIRGLSPFPGAWLNSEFGRLKILKAAMTSIPSTNPGSFTIDGKKLYLDASDSRLELTLIQPEGKPRMQSSDFLNGLVNKT